MKNIAYISAEFAIENLPTYAGGLGILAGDILYTANDLKFPLYGVTFVNKKGYARYKIVGKEIIEEEEEYEPIEFFNNLDVTLSINLKNVNIYFTVWEYPLEYSKLFLIDTDIPKNPPEFRKLTNRLYVEDTAEEKLLKDLLLGLGALKIFEAFKIEINKFHINESHAGFLAIELLKRYQNINLVKEKIVFTTHSPIAGHDIFDYNLVEKYYDIPDYIKNISPDRLNLTKILIKLSSYSNAVSWKHKKVSEKILSEKLDYITNGVYHKRWVNKKIAELYDKYIPNWRENPANFIYAANINLKEFKEIKKILKKDLVEYINANAHLNKSFNENKIIISIRRRLTEYKRFHMILWRLNELEEINRKYHIQILLSGVFHPKDTYVKDAIKWILDIMSTTDIPIGIILKRGIELEKYIISGSDLFLHTPRPPFEACGTSWMRAGINGVPTLSSRDGGVIEVIIDGYNGWLFGENRIDPYSLYNEEADIKDFYNKLKEILNLYKNSYEDYLKVCINAIKTIGSLYNSYRMFSEYIAKAYK